MLELLKALAPYVALLVPLLLTLAAWRLRPGHPKVAEAIDIVLGAIDDHRHGATILETVRKAEASPQAKKLLTDGLERLASAADASSSAARDASAPASGDGKPPGAP